MPRATFSSTWYFGTGCVKNFDNNMVGFIMKKPFLV